MELRKMNVANETGQMPAITIEQAGNYDGQEVILKGWLYNLRESGKLLFPIFRDGTGIIQGVCALRENPEAFESLKGLTQESSVIVTGKIRAEKRAPGGYEIGVGKIQIVQKVSESTPFPIQLKEHGVDFLLDQRHLWIRTPRQAAILRIRAEAIRAAREFMDSQGYTITDAPMFTPAACEGTSTLFEVNYIDDQKAYLTQSGQLYGEALAMALGKIYTFGPTFRAEKSKTRRHLTEFWMLEPEAAYVELDEAMALGMLAPEGYGEIIGGSQRIHDYELLVKRLREHNLPEEAFQWYLDLRRYGSVPHSGFGLGLERTVAWICGTEHIREVIPFPRMIYRVYP